MLLFIEKLFIDESFLLGVASTSFGESTMHLISTLHSAVSLRSLQSAIVGILPPWKLANTTKWDCFPWGAWR